MALLLASRDSSHVVGLFGAVRGEDDLLQPTARSARLYEYYLTQAGNERLQTVVIPGVGHSISMSMPGYWEELSKWLDELYPE